MKSYGISHTGNRRHENQDAYYNSDQAIGQLDNIYIVADGMGGHNGGAIASKMAVDTILSTIPEQKDSPPDIIRDCVVKANRRIIEYGSYHDECYGMGTTIDIACFWADRLAIGHVGDSRVYAYGNQALVQLTKDHSYVQELVDQGVISAQEAQHHPDKHKITRALGAEHQVTVDLLEFDRNHSPIDGEGRLERLLICSDGLTNMLSDQEILQEFNRCSDIKQLCQTLLWAALAAGGDDNITLIIIEPEWGNI